MCGITGWLSFNGEALNLETFIHFTDALAHRGPDGRGVYQSVDPFVYLGHRRLKILDMNERANQPMRSACGQYVIVFNGEIYNFLELKQELLIKGHTFFTESDTEVILAAYREWGEECQVHFNGMWAFAIWDMQNKCFFLSRDRFGVKPLYFVKTPCFFAFASEIKAFLELPGVDLSIHEQKMADTIEDPLAVESTPSTLFKGVYNLPGGHCLWVKKNGVFRQKRWWDTLGTQLFFEGSESDLQKQFQALFLDACKLRMRSDVALGTSLSGGLDSSSVLGALFQLQNKQVERKPSSWQMAFSALFPNTSQDEQMYASKAAAWVGAEHHCMSIDPTESLRFLEDALFSIENVFDPPVGPWLLYREFRKQGVVISIDGHGADELLGGYHHHYEKALGEACFPFPNIRRIQHLLPLKNSMYPKGSSSTFPSLPILLFKQILQSCCPNREHPLYQLSKKIYWRTQNNQNGYGRFGWLKIHPSSLDPFVHSRSSKFDQFSALNQQLYIDFHERTLPTILRNFDRCSMAHGVEVRAPFMDWRLVQFCFSLPSSLKVGSIGTKAMLRSSVKGWIPEEIRLRKTKIGFANPLTEWFSGSFKEYLLDRSGSQRFLQSSIWHGKKVREEIQAALEKKDGVRLRKVWEFVMADLLMEQFQSRCVV